MKYMTMNIHMKSLHISYFVFLGRMRKKSIEKNIHNKDYIMILKIKISS